VPLSFVITCILVTLMLLLLLFLSRNFENVEEHFRAKVDNLETSLQQQKAEKESVDRVC